MKTILIQTQQAFASWRSQGHRRYSDPSLKEQAVKCLEHYTHRQVSEMIGVTTNTLRVWQTTVNNQSTLYVREPAFVPVTLPDIQDELKASKISPGLRLTLPNGVMVTIEQQDLKLSVAFISALSQEFNKCSI